MQLTDSMNNQNDNIISVFIYVSSKFIKFVENVFYFFYSEFINFVVCIAVILCEYGIVVLF